MCDRDLMYGVGAKRERGRASLEHVHAAGGATKNHVFLGGSMS